VQVDTIGQAISRYSIFETRGTRDIISLVIRKNGDNNVDVIDTFYENLKYASTTPLFGLVQESARSTQLGTTILLYKLKAMYGMSDVCFTDLLR
jgi:hypothetical protein